MNSNLERSVLLCDKLIALLENDYQELYKSLKGEIYDEYKLLILDEIERLTDIKRELIRML